MFGAIEEPWVVPRSRCVVSSRISLLLEYPLYLVTGHIHSHLVIYRLHPKKTFQGSHVGSRRRSEGRGVSRTPWEILRTKDFVTHGVSQNRRIISNVRIEINALCVTKGVFA